MNFKAEWDSEIPDGGVAFCLRSGNSVLGCVFQVKDGHFIAVHGDSLEAPWGNSYTSLEECKREVESQFELA